MDGGKIVDTGELAPERLRRRRAHVPVEIVDTFPVPTRRDEIRSHHRFTAIIEVLDQARADEAARACHEDPGRSARM